MTGRLGHQHFEPAGSEPADRRCFDSVATKITKTIGLNAKIRRIVRACMAATPEFKGQPLDDTGLEGLSHIMDSSQSLCLRYAWCVVILICSSICVNQIYKCGATYYDQPVVVDVDIREEEELVFPSITIANLESDGLYKMWNEVSPNETIDELFDTCFNPVRRLMKKGGGISVQKMWRRLNTTETIVAAKLSERDKVKDIEVVEEFGLMGMQSKLELDDRVPYGGIHTKLVCDLRKIMGGCANSQVLGFIQANGVPTDLRTAWVFTSLIALDMTFTMKKFEFVSRRKDPCMDDEAYHRCRSQCAVETFKNLPCRFPFLPSEMNLPWCIAGRHELDKLYGETVVKFGQLICECPRQCQDTVFSIAVFVAGKNENITTMSAYFLNNLKTTIKERLAYDMISLLSDMGGSIGLCLGFSVLSIFQFIQGVCSIARRWQAHWQKRHAPVLFHADPIVGLVRRILHQELQLFQSYHGQETESKSLLIGVNTIMDTEAPSVLRIIWLFVIIACFLSYTLFVYVRVTVYLSDPTRMKVEVTKGNMVHFPNVTICGNHKVAITFFRRLAKKKKQFRHFPSGFSMPDWCSFQLLDLLDIPGMNAQTAWDMQSVIDEHLRADDIGEFVLGFSFLKNVSHRPVYLPDGSCIEFNVGEQIYAGTNTLFSKITFSSLDENALFHELAACNRDYNTVYITPPNEIFSLSTRLVYPKKRKTMMIFERIKLTLLNLQRKPCTDLETANECATSCFEKILRSRITCRLPYMPIFDNITDCNTTSCGKASEKSYIQLGLNFDPMSQKDCSCVRSCTKSIINTIVYVEPMDVGKMTVFGGVYFSNVEQHLIEVAGDTASKLFCDLGGNLGLALGVSLLSIFGMVQSFASTIFRHLRVKLNPKQKQADVRVGKVPHLKEASVIGMRSRAIGRSSDALPSTTIRGHAVMAGTNIAIFKNMVALKKSPFHC